MEEKLSYTFKKDFSETITFRIRQCLFDRKKLVQSFHWASSPHGHDYWATKASGRKPMKQSDRIFILLGSFAYHHSLTYSDIKFELSPESVKLLKKDFPR
jgi:hypothetical protein